MDPLNNSIDPLEACEEALEIEKATAGAFGETINDWWNDDNTRFGNVVEAGIDWGAADDTADTLCDIAEQAYDRSAVDVDVDFGLDF